MQAWYFPYDLIFKEPAGTSRGVLRKKQSWFIVLNEEDHWGIGECGILAGLSCDDRPDYESQLQEICENPEVYHRNPDIIADFPSIQAGLEMAFLSLESPDPSRLFETDFSLRQDSIPINGLIWMGDASFMRDQIRTKLEDGFSCLKMKIGAIDFDTELQILSEIRKVASSEDLTLRVDANGAFSVKEAMLKLDQLSNFDIHSIEQPIKAGQWDEMRELCKSSPLPIALDEELIGLNDWKIRVEMIDHISPPFIILKPSFIGGFRGSDNWIELAEERGIDWWATSALESNIGLNAIAQWTSTKDVEIPQGLGTGQLYTNNIPSPLEIRKGQILIGDEEWALSSFIKEHIDV